MEIACENHRDTVMVIVGNTGPGVVEKDIGKVFDQFFRSESSRSVLHGGSGLGLAIVKRIIDLHQGAITFESELNVWTRVSVTLPAYPYGQ